MVVNNRSRDAIIPMLRSSLVGTHQPVSAYQLFLGQPQNNVLLVSISSSNFYDDEFSQ